VYNYSKPFHFLSSMIRRKMKYFCLKIPSTHPPRSQILLVIQATFRSCGKDSFGRSFGPELWWKAGSRGPFRIPRFLSGRSQKKLWFSGAKGDLPGPPIRVSFDHPTSLWDYLDTSSHGKVVFPRLRIFPRFCLFFFPREILSFLSDVLSLVCTPDSFDTE